ncbi:sodium/glutamate symporter (plasmid) [Verrucomicrobiaceae bacterium 227]
MASLTIDGFLTLTIAIIALFVGVTLSRKIDFLRNYNIPEPVTGGLIAAAIAALIYGLGHLEIVFELEIRDRLLVYFFTCIGLNARLSDLIKGGRPLLILLALTLGFILIQNAVGIAGAIMVGAPPAMGIVAGSISLIGGHGTAIAWAPEAAKAGVTNALEAGMAAATMGLIIASLLGGLIAKYLFRRHHLEGGSYEKPMVGIEYEKEDTEKINHFSIMGVILTLHLAIIMGYLLHTAIQASGFMLPLYVPCLLSAIVLSNTIPSLIPKMKWPARTRALALVSDFSLGLFLTMSLMSMKLWEIANLAGPLLVILTLQTVAAVLFIVLILFRCMGRDYQAAVLSAGFGGFALGATPVAIANMAAVTKANGPAPIPFLILPLVAAFFVDVTNSFVIQFALKWLE